MVQSNSTQNEESTGAQRSEIETAGGWAAWHPVHGFGKMPNAFADIDDAIDAAKCNTILDDSPDWKAVPVEIKRKFP